MKTKVISLRITDDLFTRMERVIQGGNRNVWISEAIEEHLGPRIAANDSVSSNTDAGTDSSIEQIMKEALQRTLKEKPNFLSKLTDIELARLAVSKMAKDTSEKETKEDMFSLLECLEMLPATEDITKELNRVKGELYKAEKERDMNAELLKYYKGNPAEGFVSAVYKGAVEYTVGLVARNALPGFGDGGGLTAAGYAAIAAEVKKELDKLNGK